MPLECNDALTRLAEVVTVAVPRRHPRHGSAAVPFEQFPSGGARIVPGQRPASNLAPHRYVESVAALDQQDEFEKPEQRGTDRDGAGALVVEEDDRNEDEGGGQDRQ